MFYQNTSLWKNTLGREDKNVEPLKESFMDARKNAEFLLDKIRKDFPNLTVHDITHVDSLWNVADTIIGEEYPINPLEGYVLGIAFLIHDAALSYETVGGKDALRETVEWKDAFADGSCEKDLEEFKKDCDFVAIRALHARKAEGILEEMFCRDNGTTFYIVENDIYRTHFGKLIGKIAASHHWSIEDVESGLSGQINPLNELPAEWIVNARKLACILRCADAGHIDNGRAPDSLFRSLSVNSVSYRHWESQNHLCQVCEDEFDSTKLRITSSYPFVKEEFDAWNVAFDAVRQFDEELKKSNELLYRITPKNAKDLAFPHKSVIGAESKENLAKVIETEEWRPCNFGVHTSNVKTLIENLGGRMLYGEENMLLVAIRELVQNARDAILARKVIDDSFDEGRITIRLKEEKGGLCIEVEDNGIGMSLDCIKNHLLDFGNSYWRSPLVRREYPGLRSKGYNSVGKFGIGFYSVFMVSDSVEVITRRFDEGKEAWRIEFPKGLTLSPIMSKTNQNINVSTKVKFKVIEEILKVRYKIHSWGDQITDLSKALSLLTIGLDVDVYFENKALPLLKEGWDKSDIYYNKTEALTLIHPNVKSSFFDRKKWLDSIVIHTPQNLDLLTTKLENIIDANGDLRGWLLPPECVPDDDETPFACTIGGLSSELDVSTVLSDEHGVIGYIDGMEKSISRDEMTFDTPLMNSMQKWAKKKYSLNYDSIVNAPHSLLAYRYKQLIKFCGIQNDVVSENMKRLYSTKLSEIVVGTMNGLRKIHLLLFAGVNENARELEVISESIADRIFVLLDKPNERDRESVFSEIIDPLVRNNYDRIEIRRLFSSLKQISKMPTSNYEEIMQKYYELIKCHPFYDGNSRTLGVWVNLLLDNQCDKMIDWREVDMDNVMKLVRNEKFNEASRHLEQFLSSTYLTEMKVALT